MADDFSSGNTPNSLLIASTDSAQNPLPDCPSSPNCVRKTFRVKKSIARTGTAVLAALQQMHASSIRITDNDYEWQAVFRVLFFKDDFTIRLEPSNQSTLMYIRSASRSGYYDFGVNNRRINVFSKIVDRNFIPNLNYFG